MRLINTSTLDLKEFYDYIPPYAILSHRWELEEVSFQDLTDGSGLKMAGWAKIRGCCRQAVLNGFQWAWIDSCCIDKSSSSELSEAINSMFRWYRDSRVCYVYLSDVPSAKNNHHSSDSYFRRSGWFTRGWTLQELLAPHFLAFYDRDWVEIGTKCSLESLVSSITGIEDIVNHESVCVAQKMSWASKRQTTRVEDTAYCLMGLFGVHMPLLYGEGSNAFIRLQLELLKQSDDESIFAWSMPEFHGRESNVLRGLLSPSPALFQFSGNVRRHAFDPQRPSYSMTNKGLRMEAHLLRFKSHGGLFLFPLNCGLQEESCSEPIAVALKKKDGSTDQYIRIHLEEYPGVIRLSKTPKDFDTREVLHIEQPVNNGEIPGSSSHPPWLIDIHPLQGSWLQQGFCAKQGSIFKPGSLEIQPLTLFNDNTAGGGLIFIGLDYEMFCVIVDVYQGRPGVHLRTPVCSQQSVCDDLSHKATLAMNHRFSHLDSSDHDYYYLSPYHVDIDNLNEDFDSMLQEPRHTRRQDRLSILLASGKSASVLLRPGGYDEKSLRIGNRYVVEITVDPEGELQWPSAGGSDIDLFHFDSSPGHPDDDFSSENNSSDDMSGIS